MDTFYDLSLHKSLQNIRASVDRILECLDKDRTSSTAVEISEINQLASSAQSSLDLMQDKITKAFKKNTFQLENLEFEGNHAHDNDTDLDSDETVDMDDIKVSDLWDSDTDKSAIHLTNSPVSEQQTKSENTPAEKPVGDVEDNFADINFDDNGFSDENDMASDDDDREFLLMSSTSQVDVIELQDEDDCLILDKTGDDQILKDEDDDAENQPTDPVYSQVLKKYFGYSKFRPLQWKIINSVLNEKRDNCVIMATGYGKSLCYQFPSVFTGNITVVISPLISLMEDQVLGLKAANIPACLLGSAQEDSKSVKDGLIMHHYRLLYITPEYAIPNLPFLLKLHSSIGIDLIAIDEAHCVSQWGNDFRIAYRELGSLKNAFATIPVMALTATATIEVRRDICHSLRLQNPNIISTGFDRPNLFLSVSSKTNPVQDLKSQMVLKGNNFEFSGPTIIYCLTKKVTMEVTNILKMMGVECHPYHAGLALKIRKQTHKMFVNDKVQVIVATVAFGMGIDKPDVRTIIHYGAPKDIESYYQEIGRAGRDGLPSTCHVFYSNSDFCIPRRFISEIKDAKFRIHKMRMMDKMSQYLSSPSCRRRLLLAHFDGQMRMDIGGTQNCCDNCRRKIESSQRQAFNTDKDCKLADTLVPADQTVDLGKEVSHLLSMIKVTGGRFGLMIPVMILYGAKNQKTRKFKDLIDHEMFGAGKYRSQKFWESLGKCLLYEGYLQHQSVQNRFVTTVGLSKKGAEWLAQNSKCKNAAPSCQLVPSSDLLAELRTAAVKEIPSTSSGLRVPHLEACKRWTLPTTAVSAAASSQAHDGSDLLSSARSAASSVDPRIAKLESELYGKLLKQRNEIAQVTGFTPHNIASNKVLLDMAHIRPSTGDSLQKIEDFPAAKADCFGQQFLETVVSFCKENDLVTDQFPVTILQQLLVTGSSHIDLMKLSDTQQISYVMFAQLNKSLEEIASLRGLKTSTIVSHLCEAIRIGLPVDIRALGVTYTIENHIATIVQSSPINCVIDSLTRIKDHLPSYIEYNHIKMVIAKLVARFGQTTNADGNLVLASSTVGNTAHCDESKSPGEPLYQDLTSFSPHFLSSQSQKLEPPGLKTVGASSQESSLSRFIQTASQSETATISQPKVSTSMSDTSHLVDESLKRKLPEWMSATKMPNTSKKIKLTSLLK